MSKNGIKGLLIGLAAALAVAGGNLGVMMASADADTHNMQQDGEKTNVNYNTPTGIVKGNAQFVYADQGPIARQALLAAIPAGGQEILTGNITMNGSLDYNQKSGTLSLYMGDNPNNDKWGIVILDSKGVGHFYANADPEPLKKLTVSFSTDGYACMLVRFPANATVPATAGVVAPAATGATGVYVVQRGDTLSKIAKQLGTTVANLAAKNNIANVNVIHVGQQLAY